MAREPSHSSIAPIGIKEAMTITTFNAELKTQMFEISTSPKLDYFTVRVMSFHLEYFYLIIMSIMLSHIL